MSDKTEKSNEQQQDFDFVRNTPSHKFYMAQNWLELWDEFVTATVGKNAVLKYRTSWQFCRAKWKKLDRELAWEIIGPREAADLSNNKKRRVPWLGDWQKRRAKTWGYSYDEDKFKSINQAIKERSDQLEAMKALGPLTMRWMEKGARLADKVEEAFMGMPLDPNLEPTNKKNIERFNQYVKMLREALSIEKEVWAEWAKAHGVDPNRLAEMMGNAMVTAGQIGAAGALTGMVAGVRASRTENGVVLEGITPDHLLLAQNMVAKAEQFDLDLSNVMKNQKKEEADAGKRTH